MYCILLGQSEKFVKIIKYDVLGLGFLLLLAFSSTLCGQNSGFLYFVIVLKQENRAIHFCLTSSCRVFFFYRSTINTIVIEEEV